MHTVDPYPCRPGQASSSDDLLRTGGVDTAARRPRSPSPLFRPFTRAGWQHPPHHDSGRTGGQARTCGGGGGGGGVGGAGGHKGSLSVGTGAGGTAAGRAAAGGGGPPPLTVEEFEALPVAIQRKYFSTPERLRFVQGSRHVDGIVQHYSAITAQNAARRRRSTVTAAASTSASPSAAAVAAANAAAAAAATATPKTRRSASRSVSETFASRLRKRSMRDLSSNSVVAPDSAFYASLPDKIKKRAFSPEEQVLLSGHQGRFQSRPRPHPLLLASAGPDITLDTPLSATFSIFSDADLDATESVDGNNSTPATPTTMASPQPRIAMPAASSAANAATIARKRTSGVPDSFYDSFRCLEDGENLDLSLSLDDYHANLREAARPIATKTKSVPAPPLSPVSASSSSSIKASRPSTAFRRHLSISKMALHGNNNKSNSHGHNGSSNARPATTTQASSGHSSPKAYTSSSTPSAPPLPQTTSHPGPSSSSSLVASPSLSSLSPAPSIPPLTTAAAPASASASASASTATPPTAPSSSSPKLAHSRRKSRAMSLITPSSNSGSSIGAKHAAHGSMSSAALIDPAAAHYQDPEARLKLRLYLASPQKFDEAVQYGFPATPLTPEATSANESLGEKMSAATRRKRTASLSVTSSAPMGATLPGSPTPLPSSPLARTTTASAHNRPSWEGILDKSRPGDDDDNTAEDDDQLPTPGDPNSPMTPSEDEAADPIAAAAATTKHAAVRPYRIPAASTGAEDGAAPASREMTLRMTLTRLDLRTAEDQMYGWQQANGGHHHLGHSYQHSRKLSVGGGSSMVVGGGGNRKMAGITPASALPSASSPATAAQLDAIQTAASINATPRVTYIGGGSVGSVRSAGSVHERNAKESIEQVFAGIDQWGDLDTQEKGMMKRLWNRVRRV